MKSLLRLLKVNRRGGAREAARRTVHLFDGQRALGAAQLVEESPGGARLLLEQGASPPDAFAFVEVETALAHLAQAAWREEPMIGVKVVRSQRLRGYVPPEFAGLKRFWEEAAVLRAGG